MSNDQEIKSKWSILNVLATRCAENILRIDERRKQYDARHIAGDKYIAEMYSARINAFDTCLREARTDLNRAVLTLTKFEIEHGMFG